MTHLASAVSVLALVGTIVPPLFFLFRLIDEDSMKAIMLLASGAWFVAAPFWLREK